MGYCIDYFEHPNQILLYLEIQGAGVTGDAVVEGSDPGRGSDVGGGVQQKM